MTSRRFLLDTSVWISALRKDGLQSVQDRVRHILLHGQVFTAGIIRLELLSGAKTDAEFKRLQTRLDALDDAPADHSLWQSAARLAFSLRRQGLTIPATDVLIAACALKTASCLVHADRHFDLIAGHCSLEVESMLDYV